MFYYCLPVKDGVSADKMAGFFADLDKQIAQKHCDEKVFAKVKNDIESLVGDTEQSADNKMLKVTFGDTDNVIKSQIFGAILKTGNSLQQGSSSSVQKDGGKSALCGNQIDIPVVRDEDGDVVYRFSEEAVYEVENKRLLILRKYNNVVPYEIDKDMSELMIDDGIASYLCKKRLLDRNLGLLISPRPIGLRYEDNKMLKELLAGKLVPGIATVIVRDDSIDVDKITQKLCGTTMVLYDQDPDAFNNIDGADFKARIFFQDGNSVDMNGADGAITADMIIDEIINRNWTVEDYYDSYGFSRLIMDEQDSIIDTLVDRNRKIATDYQILKAKQEKENLKQGQIKAESYLTTRSSSQKTINTGNIYLNSGGLEELYPGEEKAIVMECLREYRKKYVQDDTRRADVLDAILNATAESSDYEKLKKAVSDAMKSYQETNKAVSIKEFEKCGFQVKSTSNHIKLRWFGDQNYTIIVPSTPSDYASMKNVEMEAMRRLF